MAVAKCQKSERTPIKHLHSKYITGMCEIKLTAEKIQNDIKIH